MWFCTGRFLWPLLVVSLLLLSSLVLGQRKKKTNKGRCKTRQDGLTCLSMKAKKLQKGVTIDCSGETGQGSGKVASLSVVGHAGQCKGLSPQMFVQVTSCLWKSKCTLKKKKKKRGLMLKVFQGEPYKCIDKQPKKFTISYECVQNNVTVLDVLSSKGDKTQDVKGILRSHQDHPWLYRRPSDTHARYLTLMRPDSHRVLVYTIRSLSLMYEDNLTVAWEGDDTSGDVKYNRDVKTQTTKALYDVNQVTFSLQTTSFTTGGEGFVICFQWASDKIPDACEGLIQPGVPASCKKNKGRGGKQGKGKEGKQGKGKGRKGEKKKKRNGMNNTTEGTK